MCKAYTLKDNDGLMAELKSMHGKMVNNTVNYIIDDEEAFKAFLKNGKIGLSNSAAERMFRHKAMVRRRSAPPLRLLKNLLKIKFTLK